MENSTVPLPRLEDYVKRPTFTAVRPGERFKQTEQVFVRAMRGQLGEDIAKDGITTPPPHPLDRTVFGPNMVRALLWPGCEAKVHEYRVPVSDKKMIFEDNAKRLLQLPV